MISFDLHLVLEDGHVLFLKQVSIVVETQDSQVKHQAVNHNDTVITQLLTSKMQLKDAKYRKACYNASNAYHYWNRV